MQSRPFYFIVTFWGQKYRDYFYSLCVPTLLAPNNIPVLKDRRDCKILVITTAEDWSALKSRPLIKRLGKYIELFHIELDHGDDANPVLHAAKGHRLGCRKAYQDRAIAGWLTPDVMISDGMIARAVDLVDRGKKVVLCPAIRFEMERPLEALHTAGYLRPDEPMILSAQFLSKIAVESLHPEILRYAFTCDDFDYYPIWSFWRVPGRNGLILYTVSWSIMFADFAAIPDYQDESFDYSTNDGFFAHQNFGHLRGTRHVAFINDSHDGVYMSLTPRDQSAALFAHENARARPINRFVARYHMGTLKRLRDIHRFHYAPELDPFRRWFHTVPIIIHSDPVDLKYRIFVVKTALTMKIATWRYYVSGVYELFLLAQKLMPVRVPSAKLSTSFANGLRIAPLFRRVVAYLKGAIHVAVDVAAGRKTIYYVMRRLAEKLGLRAVKR